MALQHMRFTYSDYSLNISEAHSDNTVKVEMAGRGNGCSLYLDEQNLVELRKWISAQLRKMNPKQSPKSVKK